VSKFFDLVKVLHVLWVLFVCPLAMAVPRVESYDAPVNESLFLAIMVPIFCPSLLILDHLFREGVLPVRHGLPAFVFLDHLGDLVVLYCFPILGSVTGQSLHRSTTLMKFVAAFRFSFTVTALMVSLGRLLSVTSLMLSLVVIQW
jgi:hypothetical protein